MTRKSSPRSSLSRREFGQRVALVTGAGITASARASVVEAPAQDDRALEKLSAEGRVRFESMWQNVLRRHGDRLTADQKTRLRKIIASNVKMLETIYAVPVGNGDAPATTLLLTESTVGRH